MATADAVLQTVQRQMKDAQRIAAEFSAVLNKVKLDERNVAQTVTGADQMKRALGDTESQAVKTKASMSDMKLGGTAGVVADAAIQKRALKELEDQAIKTRLAEMATGRQASGVLRPVVAPGGAGSFFPGASQVGPERVQTRGAGGRFGPLAFAAGPATGPTGDQLAQQAAMERGQVERTAAEAAREAEASHKALLYYQQIRKDMVDAERVRGAIPMPSAPTLVGGEQEFRQFRERLLESQRAESGALMMGPAPGRGPSASEEWFRQFETRVRGAVNTEDRVREQRARSFLSSRGIQDIGRGFESLGGGLFGRPDQAGGGGDDGRDRPGFLGFGDGRPGGIARAILSSLPGGRRPSTLALTTLAGLGVASLPAAIPATVGLGAGISAGFTSLAGTIATLQLAFADISKQAFTNRDAFEKLTPVQQQFVQTLRSLDAGLGKYLEGIAQQNLLPSISTSLHQLFTPNMTQTLGSGVQAFSRGIGGGLQQVSQMFGSKEFTNALGPVLQADARYVQSFIIELGKFADAWVHLSQAAIPFTDWLDKLVSRFANWTDAAIKSAQATGQLAHFFDQAKQGLQAFAGLAASLGGLLDSVFQLVGFNNSIKTLQLLSSMLDGIGATLNKNRALFQDAFSGLLQSIQDVIKAVGVLVDAIQPLLDQLKQLNDSFSRATGGVNLFRVALDGLVTVIAVRAIGSLIKFKLEAAETTAVAGMATSVNTLGIAATSGAAEVGRLTAALMVLKKIGVIAITLDILSNMLPQGDPTKNPIKGFPIAGSIFGFGEYVGGSRQEDTSKVPVASSALDIFQHSTRPITDVDVWSQIGLGELLPSDITALRGKFISPDQYQAALSYATSLEQMSHGNVPAGSNAMAVQGAAIVGAAGVPTPDAFAPPTPLSGTKSSIIPQSLINAIAAADFSQNTKNEIRTRQNAINWIRQHQGDFKKGSQDLGTLLQEGAALQQQIQTIQGQAVGSTARSGVGFLPDVLQQRLAQAQQAAAGVGVSGTSQAAVRAAGADQVQAQIAALRDLANVEAQAYNTLLKEHATAKEMKALTAERVAMSKELASTLKQIAALTAAEAKVAAQDKFDAEVNKILGIGPGAGVPSVAQLRTRERNVLTSDARRAGVSIPSGLSLEGMIKNLQGQGVDIPKSTLESLRKINQVLDKSLDEHKKLSAEAKANISARLSEINNTLKQNMSYASDYHVPSEKELTAGITGLSPSARKQVGERLAALAELQGKLPSSPAALGYPTSQGRQISIPLHASGTTPYHPPHVTNINGNMNIHVQGHFTDPKAAAVAIKNEIEKQARRNATQTKGPNAGRNRGLT